MLNEEEYNNEEFEDTPFEETADKVDLTPGEAGQLEALAAAEDVETPEEQVLPEELAVASPYDLIPLAIAENRHLQIVYTNRRLEMKQYIIEPYEIGGNKSHPNGYL